METKRFSLVKPTTRTPFHIDFSWWKEHDSNYRIYLLSCLCQEHRQSLADVNTDELIDWIDPVSAEVKQVDMLQNVLITHCARQPEFLSEHTAVVDAVFRVLLATGNTPTSIEDIARQINKSPETLLRTLAGPQVYKGIRPCHS